MYVLEEDSNAPFRLVKAFGLVILPIALALRVLTSSSGFAEAVIILIASQAVLVRAFHATDRENVRWGFRVRLSVLVGIAWGVLFSYSGVRVRHFSLGDALIMGAIGAALTHAIGMVFSIPVSFYCRRARRFRGELECRECGYDLRGTTTRICPECGTVHAVMRLERRLEAGERNSPGSETGPSGGDE